MSTEDKIEVYCLSGSPFVWRVLFYLEERGIKYEAKYLDSSKGENKTPEYLKLNPEGKCPTVVHNGTVIYESMAILEYFDKKFPNSKLTSEKDEELAKQLVTIHDWLSNFKMSRKVFGVPADKWDQKELFEEIENIQKWFSKLDEKVKDGFLVGDSISLADIVIFPSLAFSWRLGFDFSNYKNLDKYVNSLIERSSIKASFPPHWIGTPNKTVLGDFFKQALEIKEKSK